MRVLARVAICAAAVAVVSAMAPLLPAQAAARDGWEYVQNPSVQIDESFFMHKHLQGHPGNWHMLDVRVQQDDDGVVGGLSDFRCPKGEAPAPNRDDSCTQVGGYQFDDELGLTVTWSPRLRNVSVVGKILLEDYFHNGASIHGRLNVRLHAGGRFTRTVTHYPPVGTDPESKRIDIQRGGKITAHGHVAWLKATPAQVTNTQPLHVYWILDRAV